MTEPLIDAPGRSPPTCSDCRQNRQPTKGPLMNAKQYAIILDAGAQAAENADRKATLTAMRDAAIRVALDENPPWDGEAEALQRDRDAWAQTMRNAGLVRA